MLNVYLSGSNTRRIRGALEPLLSGAALIKSAVSRLVLRLEESYRLWQRRDLAEEKILYLYLDAIYPKVRSAGRVVSLPVLVALGVKDTGEKVLLSLMSAGAESTDGWQMLLEDLAARKMGRPRLVMSDGNPGMGAALNRLWPGVAHQRCTVHKLRNLLAKAPKHAHEAVREDYHRIVYAETRDAAQTGARGVSVEVEEAVPSGRGQFGRSRRATADVLPVPGQPAPVAAHDQHHRANAARVSSPNQNPGGPAQRRRRAAGILRVVDQRTDEAAPHQRLPRLRRDRRSCCLTKEFHDFSDKMRYQLFYRIRDTTSDFAKRHYIWV